MPRIAKIPISVQGVLNVTATWSTEEREQLVHYLQAQGTAPAMYSNLATALHLHGIFILRSFAALASAVQPRIRVVCAELAQITATAKGPRAVQAVADTAIRLAVAELKRHSGQLNLTSLLSVIERHSLKKLLDNAFPGYSAELLGARLCHESLTGNPS